MSIELDHLVVAARTLDEGVAWCEATLGVTPAAGGRHALMGTHNRLLSIASAAFPRAYLEVIAIDAQAPTPVGRQRWFDLDDPGLQDRLASGPALVHWVARCASLATQLQAMHAAGCDLGEATTVERETPRGWLRWQISIRADGRRQYSGAAPTLIQWSDVHPTDSLPASPARLESLCLGGIPAGVLSAMRLKGVDTSEASAPSLQAELSTPRGLVTLNAITTGSP